MTFSQLPDDRFIAASRLSGARESVTHLEAAILLRTQHFRTVTQHCAESFRCTGSNELAVRHALLRLHGARLLISEPEFIEYCRLREPDGESRPAIEMVRVPTRNRSSSLHASVTGICQNLQEHGRKVTIVVGDDSDPPEEEAGRYALHNLSTAFLQTGIFMGTHARRALARQISRYAQVDPQVLTFALSRDERFKFAPGINRNALLLASAGSMALMSDDDVFWPLAAAPGYLPGTKLTSSFDPTEIWFYPDHDSAVAAVQPVQRDVLSVHEELLGRTPAASIAESEHSEEIDVNGVSTELGEQLAANRGRVRVTHVGIAGDCAIGSMRHYFLWSGETRERLL
ncbi:MAG: hypothetical protein H7Y20_05030, partial [Bryobacteraceae bacterium]|nr:hypothetical protein [Bryobacteraceae bacterium]